MGGASSYISILCIAAFLAAAWTATKVSRLAGVSSIVLEIATGVILGPQVVGLITPEYAECSHATHAKCQIPANFSTLLENELLPQSLAAVVGHCHAADYAHHGEGGHSGEQGGDHGGDHGGDTSGDHGEGDHGEGSHGDQGHHVQGHDDTGDDVNRRLAGGSHSYHSYEECLSKSCEAEVSHHCGLTPDVFTLIGHAGVAMMIFESGMHFDFEKAGEVGPKACVVAVLGTFLPLVTGTVLTVLYGKPFMPDGLSVGTALAPTSVGIALRLLGEANVLQEDFGQAIITAAFVDDILSLILFNILFSLGGEFDVMATVVNPIIGIVFMGVAMAGAVKFWPRVINDIIIPRIPDSDDEAKVPRADEALFLMQMLLLILYATITHFLGTHLWGCFIAGMSFACLNPPGHAHHVWVRQTKRMTGWMIRIFFACTVAFSIPVSSLLSFEAFWKGSIMGIGPCILTKVLCAPFMGDARFVIGWAMVGRAEFAYLIAQMAAASGMIDADTFSITIWALLYATIFAPFLFRVVLTRYVRKLGLDEFEEEEEGDAPKEVVDVYDDKLYPSKSAMETYGARNVEDEPMKYGKGDPDDVVPVAKKQLKTNGNAKQPGCCMFFRRMMM